MNGWVNNGEAGDLRRHRVHYEITVVMYCEEEIAAQLDIKPFRKEWFGVTLNAI